jgi:uncharacterized protein (DUF924 family)
MSRGANTVVDFWFGEVGPDRWYAANDAFDGLVRTRFGALLAAAAACELAEWRATPTGRLAEIIVLDQFSRNIHRERPEAFAQDPLALGLAQEAVDRGVDRQLPPDRRAFLYLPFMHSESRAIHAVAARLFDAPGLEKNLDFELKHKAIIDRFGRYPHRNAVLARPSTPEELAFLGEPGSAF